MQRPRAVDARVTDSSSAATDFARDVCRAHDCPRHMSLVHGKYDRVGRGWTCEWEVSRTVVGTMMRMLTSQHSHGEDSTRIHVEKRETKWATSCVEGGHIVRPEGRAGTGRHAALSIGGSRDELNEQRWSSRVLSVLHAYANVRPRRGRMSRADL